MKRRPSVPKGERFVDVTTPVRVPDELFDRAEALMTPIGRDPEVRPMIGRMSRSAVLRLALIEGLKVLEGRYGKGGS